MCAMPARWVMGITVDLGGSRVIVRYNTGEPAIYPAATGNPWRYPLSVKQAVGVVRKTAYGPVDRKWLHADRSWHAVNNPGNPFGPAIIQLTGTGNRHIHGTSGPLNGGLGSLQGATGSRHFTHGCARLRNTDILKLKTEVDRSLQAGHTISVAFLPKLVRQSGRLGFDTNLDGQPDVFPTLIRQGGRLGFDINRDGRPDLFPTFVRHGGLQGYDIDGDGRPDFHPLIMQHKGRLAFDLDGDRRPDVFPAFVRQGGLQGFDLDGDGRPDLIPTAIQHQGRLWFDLNGDRKPDLAASMVQHGGMHGFDLDGDGRPDLLPSLIQHQGRLGFDWTGDRRPDGFLVRQRSGYGLDLDGDGRPDLPLPGWSSLSSLGAGLAANQPFKPTRPGWGGIDGDPRTPW